MILTDRLKFMWQKQFLPAKTIFATTLFPWKNFFSTTGKTCQH